MSSWTAPVAGTSLTHVDIWGIDWLLSFTLISVIFHRSFAVGGVANAINIIDGSTVWLPVPPSSCSPPSASSPARWAIFHWPSPVSSIASRRIFPVVRRLAKSSWWRRLFPGLHTGLGLSSVASAQRLHHTLEQPAHSVLSHIIEVGFSFVRKTIREGYHPSQLLPMLAEWSVMNSSAIWDAFRPFRYSDSWRVCLERPGFRKNGKTFHCLLCSSDI